MSSNNSSALLVMDVQPGIVERTPDKDAYISQVRQAVDYAHNQHMQVIYVVVSFRESFPEISSQNKSFSTMKQSGRQEMVDAQPVIELQPNDLLVRKHRVSAFSGSDLEMLLRAQNITNLILCGIATSGVVLSTLREAADRDYQLTVLSDLCIDFDDEVHQVLTEKVFPRQAEVLTLQTWLNNK